MIEHKDIDTPPEVEPQHRREEVRRERAGVKSPRSGNGNGSGTTLAELPAGPELKALPPSGEPGPPPKRRSRAWIWLLLLAGAGWLGYRAYRNMQEQRAAAEAAQAKRLANRAATVSATAARRIDLPIYLRGLGTVTAYNTANIKTRVDGPIMAVKFQEGQFVNKGDLLVQIDPRPFQATLSQAEGQLARDEAQLNDAKVNLARYQALWAAGVIAKQQLDTQAATVGQFQGTIEADQAAIQSARLNLSFANITAPISGRIGLRQVDVGNIVHPGDQNALAVITQMQPIAVLFTLPADQLQPVLAKLRAGARLPVDAYDRADVNKIASGTLETVDNQIDPSTGTARLKAVFPNQDNALFPQQFVNCHLLLETRRGAVVVPAAAVQRGPRGAFVWIAQQDGTAAMRPVTTGASQGADIQVTSGLAPGEQVITDGQDKLQQGSRIDTRQPGAAGANQRGPTGLTSGAGRGHGGRSQ